jgi:hypothetical protein
VIAENTIEQRHLTARIADVDRPNQTRKKPGEGGLAGIEIIADQRTPADPQKLDQQAGEQRFPDTRVTRGDNVELCLPRHASERPVRLEATLEWNNASLQVAQPNTVKNRARGRKAAKRTLYDLPPA